MLLHGWSRFLQIAEGQIPDPGGHLLYMLQDEYFPLTSESLFAPVVPLLD